MLHRPYLLSGLASAALIACAMPTPAYAQRVYDFDIPAQDLGSALRAVARTSGVQVIFDGSAMRGKRSARYRQRAAPEAALQTLLRGTGMGFRRDGGIYVIVPASTVSQPMASAAPPPPPPAPSQAAPQQEAVSEDIAEVIVTAQKREERIQDVPIAITALSSAALDDRKIEGGAELLRAVPNVNFSKGNFSMYNFSIRGIGTKAVSASSDPAVAVSFNNTPLVRNRLFESEFFDLQRVEVLRGPQGTLYGRNATAGVVNMIPALPEPDFAMDAKLEVGNFDTMRASGMLNVPITDTLGVRVAGAFTSRDGFDYNTFTDQRVNGRSLWSTRMSVQWEPSDRFSANFIWQHFEEDDDRARSGKQLCTNDPGPTMVGNIAVTDPAIRGRMSQGCLPGSLYDDAAYGVPNGRSLVFAVLPAESIIIGYRRNPNGSRGPAVFATNASDVFAGVTQSRNLREISTSYDPKFRATNDLFQLNLQFEPSDGLQLISQTAFARDRYYSTQDYNRFVSNPIFNDSTAPGLVAGNNQPINPVNFPGVTPGGMFCDPQLGCSDRMLSADLSRSRNEQWSQEVRLQSSFDGPLNFNVGANYLNFKTQDDYYVFNNFFTMIARWLYSSGGGNVAPLPCALGFEGRECVYVDPNPIGSLNDQGHNYFLSRNRVRIKSLAGFGELYWNVSDSLKLTLGARYTNDKKVSTQIPSQLLLGGGTDTAFAGGNTGGRVNSGYPALPDINQEWNEFTGRVVLDWKPNLGFTDDTLVYLSASRGYKGGGTNPPRVDVNPAIVQYQPLDQTFRPEYLHAFEIGMKNSFDGGRLTLNATAFYYDYKDYQISQIVDRISFNENFNATSWGLEFEAAWRPSRAFRLDANLGYLKTRLKDGSQSIDVMNRTQGNPDWVVLRPWIQAPSNCIAPRVLVERILQGIASLRPTALMGLCPGTRLGDFNPGISGGIDFHQFYGFTYDALAPYNPATVGLNINQGGSGAPNGSRGFAADLSGNELPNSPRLTFNVGGQYTFFIDGGNWELTFRSDYYRQSKSFARIYNTEYDRLKAWDNLNLAVTLARPTSGLTFQLYVKNVFDDAPITDFFTNADDTGLSANVFTLDPRIIGFSMAKKF